MIEKEEMSYALYIILSIAVLLSAFLALFLLKRRKRETRKALMDKKRINPDDVGMNGEELEMDVHEVAKKSRPCLMPWDTEKQRERIRCVRN